MNSKPQTFNSKPDDDHAAIRILYEQMINGWNNGSGEALAAPYTEDSDYIGFDGTHLKGRQEMASFHQMLFNRFIKGRKYTLCDR